MATMVEIICKCGCGRKKMVRVADKKRGWGLFYSKSCKAKWQERCTGQYRAYLMGNGVSHAAKHRGEDPSEALAAYCDKHNIKRPFKHLRTVDGIAVGPDYHGITDQDWDDISADAEMGWDAHKDTW